MGSFFLPNPLYLLIVKCESLLPLSTAKGLWRGGYFGYDFFCTSGTICTAAQFPGLRRENSSSEAQSWREGSDSAWGLGLCPTSCGLPTGSSSVTAGLLYPCQGLRTDSSEKWLWHLGSPQLQHSPQQTLYFGQISGRKSKFHVWDFHLRTFSNHLLTQPATASHRGKKPPHCHLPATTPLSGQVPFSVPYGHGGT